MRTLRLYAPAIVLTMMAVLSAVGVGWSAFAFLALALAVILHVREELEDD